MQKITIIACVAFLFPACNSGNTEKTDDPTKTDQAFGTNGWISLFDGKSTAGWHKYGGGQAGAEWKIADSTLYTDTTAKGGADLVTDEEFENFDLKLEWKISKGGNSGIIFYVHEDSAKYKHTYETGPEMQVLDNDGHADGKIIKHHAGDLYDMISCSKETVKPVGEWNQAEIKSLNGKLDFYLNGENVVSTTMWDDNWKNMVANSKFKDMTGFGIYKKGHIALQDHGNAVWFRNIQVKKL